MSVIWRKVWRDIWSNAGRTVQVVLSIAVGVFAVGLTLGMFDLVETTMTETWQAANPAHIQIWAGGGQMSDEVVEALAHVPGVAGTEGMATMDIRWREQPADPWRDATVNARDDYAAQTYDRLTLLAGQWPIRGGIAVDHGGAKRLGIDIGDTIYFEVNEKPKAMQVVGLTYGTWVNPPAFSNEATFYSTRQDMLKLDGPVGYSQVKAVLPEYEEERAKEVAAAMAERLDDLGIGHGTPQTFDPSRHFFQDTANGIFLLLVVMSFLTLGLSLFLVVNTITAIITRQVPQIGIMKTIGARTRRIFRVYLSGVMVYVVLALIIAIPLSIAGTHALTVWLMDLFNIRVETIRISNLAVATQVGLGLISPLLAAVWPVSSGARITVREALSTYGLGEHMGLIQRALARLHRLPPLISLAISNTFRRKGRLALTQIALIGGGAIFMMVISVYASMNTTIDIFLDTYNFNVWLNFSQPQRIESIETQVSAYPGVTYAEVLQFGSGEVRRLDDPDGLDAERIVLLGVADNGDAYQPQVTAGRWLLPEDDTAIVMNQGLAKDLDVGVGEVVTLELAETEKEWTIVGLLFDINSDQRASAVRRDVLGREQHSLGRGGALLAGTEPMSDERLTTMERDMRTWLTAGGKEINSSFTSEQFRSEQLGSLLIIVYLLAIVAVLIAVVGSIGLSGTLSINALERRREIGVMRAIGASGPAIGSIFIGEGMLIGLLSWAVAVPLSVPLGKLLTEAIANTIDLQLTYEYSMLGALLWLIVVVVLSALASGLPAWRAAQLSVEDVLAYE